MDVSGEAADLVVKESLQVTETTAKLTGSAIKNVAALLIALAKDNYKVTGKTSVKRLTRDPTPALVIHLKKEDMAAFGKLAKEYGILYFIAQKKGNASGLVNIVSNQNYAAKLNAVMEELHYPVPEQTEKAVKKATPRAPQEKSSPERGNGLTQEATGKPSVKRKLAALDAAAKSMQKQSPIKDLEHTR